jgi:alkanesulfonate monooxygenase SsuD/methylene tetrahydromethanopterin reductase-like flavin-dependent oxidoreductase (luciferase family)
MNELLLSLIGHMRWADAIVAESLRNESPDPEAARLFAHIASVEHLWFARIERRPAAHDVWPAAMTPAQAAALAAEHADLYQRLVEGANAEQLARSVAYRNSAGRDFRSRVSDIGDASRCTAATTAVRSRARSAGVGAAVRDFIQYTRRDP